jgi:hypothetical protein
MVLSFATLFFNHSLSALVGFAPFALLFRERRGPPRIVLVAVAGFVVGLSYVIDYQTGIYSAIVLGLYALRTRVVRDAALRGATFVAGVLVGALPAFLFNYWAFGSFTHNVYDDYWREHPEIGAHLRPYTFHPDYHTLTTMLFSAMGLFVLAPVLLAGVVGVVLLWRRGHGAEPLVIAGVSLLVIVYQSGLGGFGGEGPPRYLMPLVPYLGVAIAPALRAFPLTTLALAAISIFQAVVQDSTGPLTAYDGQWLTRARGKEFVQTASAFVEITGWYTIAAYFLAVAVAIVVAVVVTRLDVSAREAPFVLAGLAVWALVAFRAWNPFGVPPSDAYIAATTAGSLAAAAAVATVRRHGSDSRRSRLA